MKSFQYLNYSIYKLLIQQVPSKSNHFLKKKIISFFLEINIILKICKYIYIDIYFNKFSSIKI